MDLCSRRLLGWAMATRITQELTLSALRMAVFHGRRPKLHHPDRGSQYACKAYRETLDKLGIEASMSRKGDCWKDGPMESFIHSLKVEWTRDVDYATRDEARADIFEYLEVFYDRRWRHSSLGFLSPVEFEIQCCAVLLDSRDDDRQEESLSCPKPSGYDAGDLDLQRAKPQPSVYETGSGSWNRLERRPHAEAPEDGAELDLLYRALADLPGEARALRRCAYPIRRF